MVMKRSGENLWLIRGHALRWLLDLQYRGIHEALERETRGWPPQGRLLDFGAGESPYRALWPPAWQSVTVDPAPGVAVDYRSLAELPPDDRFDRILMLEVLEHLPAPEDTLRALRTKLASGGRLLISVPFAARIHPAPQDFHRWTPDGLAALAGRAGFRVRRLEYRGGELATLVQKLNYYFFRRLGNPLAWLGGMIVLPFWLVAQVTLLAGGLGGGASGRATEDPLGFFVELEPA